jgi:hypothetical protein
MLLDVDNLLLDGIAVTAIPPAAPTTADGVITGAKSIDLASANRRRSGVIKVMAMIHGAAVVGGTSLNVQIFTGAAAATATTKVAESGVILQATMVAGYEFPIEIPQNIKLLRYLTVVLVQAGTAFTGSGLLTVGLVPDGDAQTAQI